MSEGDPTTFPIDDPSWIPPRRAIPPLLLMLAAADDDTADSVARALARAGSSAFLEAAARLQTAEHPLAGRLCRLLSRAKSDADRSKAREALIERIEHGDDRVARAAASALGRLGGNEGERAMVARLSRAEGALSRALVEALGKTGSRSALAAIEAHAPPNSEAERAKMRIERSALRSEDRGSIVARAAPHKALDVVLIVRAGLEVLAAKEAAEVVRQAPRVLGRGQVGVVLDGPLDRLLRLRIPMHVAFPLPTARARLPREGEALERAVVDAMTSKAAQTIFATFNEGAIRYRIEWTAEGHRRAATMRVATAIAAQRRELVNDPTDSTWELSIDVARAAAGEPFVLLWPRGLPDDRFGYRQRDVPAASHPTIAAALAFAGGAFDDDVVWDPFVGSGRELIERARLGRYEKLFGSDTSPQALTIVHENLRDEGLLATLLPGSATGLTLPTRPSLVLTNPPMGRRVLERKELPELLTATLENIARQLRRPGRLAWLSPLFGRTVEVAKRLGFSVEMRSRVDMGGFDAELQVLRLQ